MTTTAPKSPAGSGARLRGPIARSWERCASTGLDQGDDASDGFDITEPDPVGRLVTAAQPVLDAMERDLVGTRYAAILADADARVTAMRFGRPDLRGVIEAAGAVHGREFAEGATGTNAIATVHAMGEGLVVDAAEHYLERWRCFSCYGHPVTHPVTGALAGVLDVTGPAGENPTLLAPFVRRAVRDIEDALLEASGSGQQQLLAAYRTALARDGRADDARGALLAIGPDLVLANRQATDLLDAADHTLLRDLTAGREVCDGVVVELSAGPARVCWQPVPEARGAVLRLRHTREAGPGVRSGGLRTTGPRTGLPDAVLVAGEPGTGRTAAVGDIVGDARCTVLEAADLTPASEHGWLVRAARSFAAPGEVTVVEDVHLLLASTATRLRRLLATPHARTVLTCCPVDDLTGEVAALAADCARREELAPLRTRAPEIPAIVERFLRDLGADGSVRFTAEALAVLAAARWPGNLRELAAVVAETAARRSAGDLAVHDLPEAYRRGVPVGESAGELARAERAAIEAALRACDGNKLRAARRLGISRSTLYTRLRALRVTL